MNSSEPAHQLAKNGGARIGWLDGILLTIYLVAMAAGTYWMFQARHWAVENADNPQVHEDFQVWSKEARRQSEGEGPVYRKPLKSSMPASIVLLNDHFGVCLAGVLLFATAIYGSFAFFLRGVLKSPS